MPLRAFVVLWWRNIVVIPLPLWWSSVLITCLPLLGIYGKVRMLGLELLRWLLMWFYWLELRLLELLALPSPLVLLHG